MDGSGILDSIINGMGGLPDADRELFHSIWSPFAAARKTALTLPGAPERFLYVVLEGVQRIYYFDSEGREATLVFTYVPSFGGVLDSLMLQQPSKYYYETLTKSVFLRTTYASLAQVMDQCPAVERMVRLGTTHALSGLLERLAELQCYSSEDKFRKLAARSPHILNLIPHKYLANYLGIDPTNFSKFMNRIKI